MKEVTRCLCVRVYGCMCACVCMRESPTLGPSFDHLTSPPPGNELILKKARSILNKLTVEKFDRLSDDFMNCGLDSEVLLKGEWVGGGACHRYIILRVGRSVSRSVVGVSTCVYTDIRVHDPSPTLALTLYLYPSTTTAGIDIIVMKAQTEHHLGFMYVITQTPRHSCTLPRTHRCTCAYPYTYMYIHVG